MHALFYAGDVEGAMLRDFRVCGNWLGEGAGCECGVDFGEHAIVVAG